MSKQFVTMLLSVFDTADALDPETLVLRPYPNQVAVRCVNDLGVSIIPQNGFEDVFEVAEVRFMSAHPDSFEIIPGKDSPMDRVHGFQTIEQVCEWVIRVSHSTEF